uniref:Nucleolar complex protein 3 homolog n=1 Tax=Eptatretus burgeri TaxID=7764 RepID=A0A8C4QD90_EPTBU
MAPVRKRRGMTKKAPTFRRLLKTSNEKMQNKLRERKFRQRSTDKHARKEQRKLRSALRHAPPPQGASHKSGDRNSDDLEVPWDMMEGEENYICAVGQHTAFLDQHLVESAPPMKRRCREDNPEPYEVVPRSAPTKPSRRLVHLLPIKDSAGIHPRVMERPVTQEEVCEEGEDVGKSKKGKARQRKQRVSRPLAVPPNLSETGLAAWREKILNDKKRHIALLASSVLTDPHNGVQKLKELRAMLGERCVAVSVAVRRLVMLSLAELFCDITPSYYVRPLTEAELAVKVRKEVKALRDFEKGLVNQYRLYLEALEQVIRAWQKGSSGSKRGVAGVVSEALQGLAEVAVRCLCRLVVGLPHFNFHRNVLLLLVPLMDHKCPKIGECCRAAISKMFREDRRGESSLAATRLIAALIRKQNFQLHPEVIRVLLNLRVHDVEVQKDAGSLAPTKKGSQEVNLSRMQRKRHKAEEKLQRELLEAEATENKELKLRLQTETLNVVFLIYFRILKKSPNRNLLPPVLEGLARFSHLINVAFFDDLLMVLHKLIESKNLKNRERLHCIQTAFHILSGQGEALNIDPQRFYKHMYSSLFQIHCGSADEDVAIVLRCLDAMLLKRRRQVSTTRVLAFTVRLGALALQLQPNGALGILATLRSLFITFSQLNTLLDGEEAVGGVYQPLAEEPEQSQAQGAALWGLIALKRHFHPTVRQFSGHILAGAPTEGRESLPSNLSRSSPSEVFGSFSGAGFNPPIPNTPATKKVRLQH